MEKKINLAINDGDSFFAHQASINFNPSMIFLDFKSVSPRIDERVQDGNATFVLKHNVVMLEPYHCKLFANLLNKVVHDYEKQFGTLEKPKAIKNLEKTRAKEKKSHEKNKSENQVISDATETPNYFG